jgi:hypothetical protein
MEVTKASPGPVFEAAMQSASASSGHYNTQKSFSGIMPLKKHGDVTNHQFGRNIPVLRVEAPEEAVPPPKDMTRQIPRYNIGTQMGYNDPFKVSMISQQTAYVPRRAPVVVHGVNSLKNSQANVIKGDAEFFGDQQSVRALKDTLNYDPLDSLKKDMLRVSKADSVDEIQAKSGLHNTKVVRSRTRKRAGQIYV